MSEEERMKDGTLPAPTEQEEPERQRRRRRQRPLAPESEDPELNRKRAFQRAYYARRTHGDPLPEDLLQTYKRRGRPPKTDDEKWTVCLLCKKSVQNSPCYIRLHELTANHRYRYEVLKNAYLLQGRDLFAQLSAERVAASSEPAVPPTTPYDSSSEQHESS